MKALVYELWDDKSYEFRQGVKRMIRLGYSVKVVSIEKEFQQNQQIGTINK